MSLVIGCLCQSIIAAAGVVPVGIISPHTQEASYLKRGIDAAMRHAQESTQNIPTLQLVVADSLLSTPTNALEQLTREHALTTFFPYQLPNFIASVVAQKTNEPLLYWGVADNQSLSVSLRDRAIVRVGHTLERELAALISYVVHVLHARSCAVMFEASAWGRAGLSAVEETIKRLRASYADLRITGSASYPLGTVAIEAGLEQIARYHPDVIICVMSQHAGYHFIQKALRAGLSHAIYCGPMRLLPLQKHVFKTRGINLVCSSSLPNMYDMSWALVRAFHADTSDEVHPLSFFSYVATRLFLAGLMLLDESYSPRAYINMLTAQKNVSVDDWEVRFDKEKQAVYGPLWISPGYGEKWQRAQQ